MGEIPEILTHWGRVTHICVSKVNIIVSDNGLSPDRRQAIIWNNAGILLIGPLGTNFAGILIEIQTFSFKKMHVKMSSGKWRPFVSASIQHFEQPHQMDDIKILNLNKILPIPTLKAEVQSRNSQSTTKD